MSAGNLNAVRGFVRQAAASASDVARELDHLEDVPPPVIELVARIREQCDLAVAGLDLMQEQLYRVLQG